MPIDAYSQQWVQYDVSISVLKKYTFLNYVNIQTPVIYIYDMVHNGYIE